MPRLTETERVVSGLGVHPWDATRDILQKCSGDPERCRIVLSDDTLISERGANELVGRNGQWAAWLDGYGVFDSYGNHFPESALCATRMSEDGWYCRKVLRQSGGIGEPPASYVLQRGSQVVPLAGVPEYNYAYVLPSARAVWVEGGRLQTHGIDVLDPGRMLLWPVPIFRPDGVSLLYWDRATKQLVLDGRVIQPASDEYFYPDAKFIDGRFVVTWSPNQGDLSPVTPMRLTQAELALRPAIQDAPPIVVPPPQPKPPEPKPMSVPDLSSSVVPYLESRLRKLATPETTDQNSFAALNDCCNEVRKTDSRFGLLLKTGGHRQRDRSVDVLAYDLKDGTCQLVKVIHDAEGMEDGPSAVWSIVDDHGIRPIGDWKEPYGSAQPPTAETHKYVGGGNDTGTCDRCGKSRFDPVHAVPESKLPHVYDGGEQDTGLCDICQKGRADAIHQQAPPPPPVDQPPVEQPPAGAATADLQAQQLVLLLQIVAKLDAQAAQQQQQGAALEAAIKDLKAEIAKGIKLRFS